ncbi:MAG: hypothetical protein EXR05_03640 [Acetobacteraceae bacterium]|nr:hypothetical protein [Acetobacteraceae bacterium]
MRPARSCAACGAPAAAAFRAPPAEMAPDLDFRPGEPTRGTQEHWLQTCPTCGAVGPDLAALCGTTAVIIASPAYRDVVGPAYALAFLRWATLCGAAGDARHAGEAFLQAAWTADDAGDAAHAAQWRRDAARVWDEPDIFEIALRQIDALRRAGDFTAAEVAAKRLAAQRPDDTTAQILAFQRARIVAGDAGRHLMSSALLPPAHTPHVAHGKASGKGFIARLFGR